MNYQDKYLKYKNKYLVLKKEVEDENNLIIEQNGGLFVSCGDYYNDPNLYRFNNKNEMYSFLINLSGMNNNWSNLPNTASDYKNTLLYELIQIDFDVNNRFDELPELVKLLLHIRPKPAHLLQMCCLKETADFYTSVLRNTYEGGITTAGYYLTSAIHSSINKNVIEAVEQILDLLPESENTNTWDSLTKVLEFLSCISDSAIFTNTLFSSITGRLLNSLKDSFNNLIIQIVFLEDIVLYNKNRRKFRELYKNHTTDNSNENHSKLYNNFVLKDFFDPSKNTINILPPSLLLLLSIKLNPIINKSTNAYNKSFRSFLQYSRYECGYHPALDVENSIEAFTNEPKDKEFTEKDSELLDTALLPIVNGNSEDQSKNENLSLFEALGLNSKKLYTQVLSGIKNITNINSLVKSINIFQSKQPKDRVSQLKEKIIKVNNEKAVLLLQMKEASSSKKFSLFKSDKEIIDDKIKQLDSKLRRYEIEIAFLEGKSDSSREQKLNLILSNILSLVGVGLDKLNTDVCKIGDSEINFRSFDKIFKILDGNFFKIINFTASKYLTHTLMQNITPFTIYLPFDIRTYFYKKLKLNTAEKINKFNHLYDQYEKLIYEDFIHNDDYYYTEKNKDGSPNVNALFPPAKLLNDIKDQL